MKSKNLVFGIILTALSLQAVQPAFAAPNDTLASTLSLEAARFFKEPAGKMVIVGAYHLVSVAVGGIIAMDTSLQTGAHCPYGFQRQYEGHIPWVSYQKCFSKDSNGETIYSGLGGPNEWSTSTANILMNTAAVQAVPYAILLGQFCVEKIINWTRSGIQDPESSLRKLEEGEAVAERCELVKIAVPCKAVTKEMIQIYKPAPAYTETESLSDNLPTYESAICPSMQSSQTEITPSASLCHADEIIAILEALPQPACTLPTVSETPVVSEEPCLLAE